ncbi:MAG: hypothetical protein WAR83_12930 [Flavobacteriales bacterium]|nr:hypothetical protein [Flavobacteriales bacterium]
MQGSAHHTATIQAHKLLGDERVIAFLKAAGFRSNSLAIDLANGFLRDGRSVQFILTPPVGGSAGFTLFAHYIQPDLARMEFALWTDQQKRSGSTWEVRFVQNEVVELVDMQSTPHEFAAIARASMRVA